MAQLPPLPERVSILENDLGWIKDRLTKLDTKDSLILLGQGITSAILVVFMALK